MKLNVDDLVEQKLVRKKTYASGKYAGLSVLKYTNKVFFDNLWHIDERLLDCRGTVVDENDNIICLPFKKVFNLGENNTTVDDELIVIAPRKVNGFLGVVTKTEKYGLIISTSGSLDSEYVDIAKKHILELNLDFISSNCTYLFEICDKSDPHIVAEDEGAYLIGMRSINDGILQPELLIDMVAESISAKRPEVIQCKFKDLPATEREGYMIRDAKDSTVLCKLKSPHYLSKKALQRCGKNKANKMWSNPMMFRKQLDEEFYDIFYYLINKYTKEEYLEFTEQERRMLIENYFNKK